MLKDKHTDLKFQSVPCLRDSRSRYKCSTNNQFHSNNRICLSQVHRYKYRFNLNNNSNNLFKYKYSLNNSTSNLSKFKYSNSSSNNPSKFKLISQGLVAADATKVLFSKQ